jgi:UPF0716 protein FxsA
MLGRLLLLFLLTPVIELGLLIQVDRLIGFWPTVGLILATGITGSYLARREGVSAWRRLNERLRAGDLPGTELVEGVIILVAGALLITPGVLTDVFGFLGLLPPTRAFFRRILIRRLQRRIEQGSMQIQFGAFGGSSPGPGPPPGSSPSEAEETGDSESDAHWKGHREEIPHYTDDDDSSSDDNAPSS